MLKKHDINIHSLLFLNSEVGLVKRYLIMMDKDPYVIHNQFHDGSLVSALPIKGLVDMKSKTFHLPYTYVVVNFDALAQATDFRIKRIQVDSLCWIQDSMLGSLRRQIANRLNTHSQTDWAIEDQANTWTPQPVSTMSEHSAQLTSFPIGFHNNEIVKYPLTNFKWKDIYWFTLIDVIRIHLLNQPMLWLLE